MAYPVFGFAYWDGRYVCDEFVQNQEEPCKNVWCSMSGWQGPPVLVGEKSLWLGSGSGLPKLGTVRWIGRLPEIGPDWTVGLELNEALPIGGIDGSWRGRELFKCKSKHGLLVPISSIIPGSQLKHIAGLEKSQNAEERCCDIGELRLRKPLPKPHVSPVVAESKTLPRPAARHKRRIQTPPPSPSDSDDTPTIPQLQSSEPSTLRVEEDSLKKRLRLFADNNGPVQRMNRRCNEEVDIEALYAQRRQQFAKHGRSHSDSSRAFVSSASSPGSRRDRNSIFSIFRWFRKESKSDDLDEEFAPSAPPSPQLIKGYSSSCGSVDTLFSTATASSFAFVQPALYRPFGAGSPPERRIIAGPETDTYRNRLRQRDRVRELDRHLTLKKKYHLFGSGTLHRSVDDVNVRHYFLNKSLDSLKVSNVSPESKSSTLSRKKRKAPPPPSFEENSNEPSCANSLDNNKENKDINNDLDVENLNVVLRRPQHRRTVSDSAQDRRSFVHVKGKRKAPPPPINNNVEVKNTNNEEAIETQSLNRKKRHAPPPPLEILEDNSKSADTDSCLNSEEKQRLIENIAKLQAHADRQSLLLSSPPASPTVSNKMSHTVCNDSLKLERGVLKANKTEVQCSEMKPTTPTPVSPRPWYKRNMATKEKSLEKKSDKNNIEDWMPDVAIARTSVISQDTNSVSSSSSNNSSSFRLSSIFSRFEKPEEKRKSQISMLVNISELDREAAEIVQREHEKEKAILAAEDAKYYTTIEEPPNDSNEPAILDIIAKENKVDETGESPRRTGARELISLFNSITNVTKVTVNSAFFSKDGPSIFTKEGVEKRFSASSASTKTAVEKTNDGFSKINGYKTETVTVETKETYLGSPGFGRRLKLLHQDIKDTDYSSEAASPQVVIEEIEDSDLEKSRIQAMYEANRIRKHLTPSPTIPTIAEMSESITSIATSPGSTLNTSERGNSVTPTPVEQTTASAVKEPQVTKPTVNYSIWTCPRCTLENPRWRVTCEACDMWRPAVRRDVIDKLTNANMGSTIAVNVVKAGKPKSVSVVKSLTSEVVAQDIPQGSQNSVAKETINVAIADKPKSDSAIKSLTSKSIPHGSHSSSKESIDAMKADKLKNVTATKSLTSQVVDHDAPCGSHKNAAKERNIDVSSNNNLAVKATEDAVGSAFANCSKVEISKPITVSGLLSNSSYKPKEPLLSESEKFKPSKSPRLISAGASATSKVSSAVPSSASKSAVCQKESKTHSEAINGTLSNLELPKPSTPSSANETEIDEVRKARLAFFQKDSSVERNEEKEMKKDCSQTRPSINQAKIDTLFSIASKGSLATNEEERQKIKEILKEMKDSLPKKSKQNKSEAGCSKNSTKPGVVKTDNIQISISPTADTSNATRLGAIKKSSVQNFSPSSNAQKSLLNSKLNDVKKSEVYLVKTETVIEEIKVKGKDGFKTPKISTSVQTNGIIRQAEPSDSSSVVSSEAAKSVSGKPPTPKATRKEVLVPVTVEDHAVVNGVAHKTTSKEQRKMDIGNFELIRPRDFASIEATKTGNEVKAPVVHFYANLPSTRIEDLTTVSTSSSSSDSSEITQLTAQLTKPKGLADFKASVLESVTGNKMNTLAVNRLLRQLETAIVGGEHQRAATLAKQLAKHKVNCCVTRQKQTDFITVNMYVEDKLLHQGPFPVQVSPTMTVAQLKSKVEREFEIPATVQRWILGKELAADDNTTLRDLGVDKPQCPIFLYLVAPEISQNRAAVRTTENEALKTSPVQVAGAEGGASAAAGGPPAGRGWYYNADDERYSLCESETTDHSSENTSPVPQVEAEVAPQLAGGVTVEEPDSEEEVDEEEEAVVAGTSGGNKATTMNPTETTAVGWKCAVCTLMNSPTRPGCLACTTDRPADYQVPQDHQASGAERQRLHEDQQVQQAAADQKLKNYQDLMVLENADLIPSTERFECGVCLAECAAGDGAVLRDCLHTFCRACLAQAVQFSEDAEVKCPFRDHNYACDSTLQEREIKALVSPEVYEQHLAKSMTEAENKIGNAFHCKTPDCPGWCIFEDNVNTFQCPVCNEINCLTCQAIHTGLDCKQFQEQAEQEAETNADARRTREMLEQMVERGEALACPTCQVVLMKKWGCDWLRCSMCKTEICWVTRGPRWGSKGKGDTSGGCQCGVNGVKCHPKCNYCH